MTEKLLPCPFCGGEPLEFRVPGFGKLWRIECKNCDAGPRSSLGIEEARMAWNRRAAPPQSNLMGPEECAAIVDELITDPAYGGNRQRRFALIVAARAIRRGRNLSQDEKLENFRAFLAEEDTAITEGSAE